MLPAATLRDLGCCLPDLQVTQTVEDELSRQQLAAIGVPMRHLLQNGEALGQFKTQLNVSAATLGSCVTCLEAALVLEAGLLERALRSSHNGKTVVGSSSALER